MSASRLVSRSLNLWMVFVALGLLVAGGCTEGGYSGPTGTVSGTVTLGDQPVPQGSTVAFVSDAGFTASGQVGGLCDVHRRVARPDDE